LAVLIKSVLKFYVFSIKTMTESSKDESSNDKNSLQKIYLIEKRVKWHMVEYQA